MKGEFLAAINMLSAERGVSADVVVEAMESALVAAYKRNTSETTEVVAHIDPGTGETKVLVQKTVVDGAGGPDEIQFDAAQKLDPEAIVGGMVWEEVPPVSLGRIAAQGVKQHIAQKLREAERKRVYDEFAERTGEILHALVQRIEARTVILELGKTEAVMPPPEQVPTERYYPGQRLRVYLVDVVDSHRGPQLLVSRSHKMMIKRLLEQEVPEIFNGSVEIKAIAREPGARSKVAVTAREEGIDPVGSCVGMRGVRIQNIVNELSGEKIDIIPWDGDPAVFVASALSPAQVLQVTIDEDSKTATVVVPERQLSLAIGREGQNARLAARLTNWRIDIKSDVVAATAGIWSGPTEPSLLTVVAALADVPTAAAVDLEPTDVPVASPVDLGLTEVDVSNGPEEQSEPGDSIAMIAEQVPAGAEPGEA
ncbi:MAG: transcription termination/antitermination protein NusA [Chloroflexi bacterium]|nr:transcription termination/antitermination protein NusA [Chloroflexota bacterium]